MGAFKHSTNASFEAQEAVKKDRQARKQIIQQ